MNNFARAHNSYLEPPDESEAVLCDDCGEEMEVKEDLDGTHYTKCNYQWCPAKFEGDAREMAIELYRLKDDKNILTAKLERKTRQLDRLQKDIKEAIHTA